jgi:hypothetical protein
MQNKMRRHEQHSTPSTVHCRIAADAEGKPIASEEVERFAFYERSQGDIQSIKQDGHVGHCRNVSVASRRRTGR